MPLQLVVLDRDGVINRDSREFVKSAAEWQALDGSLQAIGVLTRAGYTVAVASNQSGIGRGLFGREALHAMHRKMRRLAAREGGIIDRIVCCPHRPEEGCDCRKPKPGLLKQLERHYGVSMRNVPVVGDSGRDLEAAVAVGARPVLVRSGNGRATERALGASAGNVEIHDDLLAFARALTGNGQAEMR
jgi:D-glycero-D-manno-heptose 1,7-bisphosphate phosphatase